jgi:SAM-dependent methyltransferase
MTQKSGNPILDRIYRMSGSAAECRDVYRDWARRYDEDTVGDMGYVGPQVVADKLASLVRPDASVLDAGCGTGLAGAELAERGFTAIDGMDLSPDMLAVAREKAVYRDLREEDLTRRLSYDDGAYDAVGCVGTFTHAHVGPQGFDELLRVTRAGGPVVATVHEGVWGDGYEEHFRHLEAAGVARVSSVEDSDYHLHGCKLCVLTRL